MLASQIQPGCHAIPTSVEDATDVGSHTGNFSRLAGTKGLPEVGYQSMARTQKQIETCPCIVGGAQDLACLRIQAFQMKGVCMGGVT